MDKVWKLIHIVSDKYTGVHSNAYICCSCVIYNLRNGDLYEFVCVN